jgi:hypothetical protein
MRGAVGFLAQSPSKFLPPHVARDAEFTSMLLANVTVPPAVSRGIKPQCP